MSDETKEVSTDDSCVPITRAIVVCRDPECHKVFQGMQFFDAMEEYQNKYEAETSERVLMPDGRLLSP